MYGLAVNLTMSPSEHPSIINEIMYFALSLKVVFISKQIKNQESF